MTKNRARCQHCNTRLDGRRPVDGRSSDRWAAGLDSCAQRLRTRYHYPVSTSSSSFSILTNQPPLDHERFAAHRELESLLKSTLRGDVSFDLGSRAMYAADSSNYRQLPVGVVLPRDAADVEAALAACRKTGAAVLPRGAGTSLAGQCANVAVVFDYSRYMHGLNFIDPAASLARVEPGIVLARSRHAQPVHAGRHDRQQQLRRPRPARRQGGR